MQRTAHSVALQRYLQRHIEPDLPEPPAGAPHWQRALVIPAYREPPSLLRDLGRLPPGAGKLLVILVLNRPDSDPDTGANTALRNALKTLDGGGAARPVNHCTDLYLYDMEATGKLTPASQGVGLARKTGCDVALKWIHEGAISGDWIGSTDADALLPADYWGKLQGLPTATSAAVFPFHHVPGPDASCNEATMLYELRLHHYVLGLEFADSPYAYHTLGSCLAVRAESYARVRGFPKRAGGEDFYLLSKLAKTGPIARLAGPCIHLQSRYSERVPFGTGPAVAAISRESSPQAMPLFYHPGCFLALRAVLQSIPSAWQARNPDSWEQQLKAVLPPQLARAAIATLAALGIEKALQHCRSHGKSPEQFQRQFHQWFDAFRTLKFIHGMRDSGWPEQALHALTAIEPDLWPQSGPAANTAVQLCDRTLRHWGWTL